MTLKFRTSVCLSVCLSVGLEEDTGHRAECDKLDMVRGHRDCQECCSHATWCAVRVLGWSEVMPVEPVHDRTCIQPFHQANRCTREHRHLHVIQKTRRRCSLSICCHKGTAVKQPVPDRVKLSAVIFDIQALMLSPERQECPDVKNYKWWLNPVWYTMLYSCTHIAAVGVKGLLSDNLLLLFVGR